MAGRGHSLTASRPSNCQQHSINQPGGEMAPGFAFFCRIGPVVISILALFLAFRDARVEIHSLFLSGERLPNQGQKTAIVVDFWAHPQQRSSPARFNFQARAGLMLQMRLCFQQARSRTKLTTQLAPLTRCAGTLLSAPTCMNCKHWQRPAVAARQLKVAVPELL